MRTISFLSMLSLVLLLTACNKDKNSIDISLNNDFELAFDQTAFFKDDHNSFTIKFIEVVRDIRCPSDLDCFWEGLVDIKVKVNLETIELATSNKLDGSITAVINDYRIRLKEIKPARGESNNIIKEKDYSAVLEITKRQ